MSEIETYVDPVGPSGSSGWANTTTGDPLKLLFGIDQPDTLTATDQASAIERCGGGDTLTGGAGDDPGFSRE